MMGSTLPGCIGYYWKPCCQNGPCSQCQYRVTCKTNFSDENPITFATDLPVRIVIVKDAIHLTIKY